MRALKRSWLVRARWLGTVQDRSAEASIRAMGDRHGKRPKPQLRRWYPRQRPRMTPIDEPEDTEANDQDAGENLDLQPPFDKRDQQRERQEYEEHRQEMTGRQRQSAATSARELFSISPAERASGHPIPGLTP